jgi:hypothetical protein
MSRMILNSLGVGGLLADLEQQAQPGAEKERHLEKRQSN